MENNNETETFKAKEFNIWPKQKQDQARRDIKTTIWNYL